MALVAAYPKRTVSLFPPPPGISVPAGTSSETTRRYTIPIKPNALNKWHGPARPTTDWEIGTTVATRLVRPALAPGEGDTGPFTNKEGVAVALFE